LTFQPQPALHPIFEALGYVSAYLLYKRERARQSDSLGKKTIRVKWVD